MKSHWTWYPPLLQNESPWLSLSASEIKNNHTEPSLANKEGGQEWWPVWWPGTAWHWGLVCWGIVVVQNPGVGRPQLPSLAPNFCHQPGQYLFVKMLVYCLIVWYIFMMDHALVVKEGDQHLWSTFTWDFCIRAFFGLGEPGDFHWQLWRFVSGSYSKIHDSSPVMTFSKCGVRLQLLQDILAHMQSAGLLILRQQPRNHFGTHLPHSQVVNQNASNQFLINPKLVRHHANGEAAVGAHQFSHLFDVDISFDAARPSRFSIIPPHSTDHPQTAYATQRLLSETCKNRRIPQATC